MIVETTKTYSFPPVVDGEKVRQVTVTRGDNGQFVMRGVVQTNSGSMNNLNVAVIDEAAAVDLLQRLEAFISDARALLQASTAGL